MSTGNIGCYFGRSKMLHDASEQTSYGVLVTSLAFSDVIMGLYLAVIGLADLAFSKDFLYHDESWKRGEGCRVAGFLFILGKEASTCTLLLLMVERLVALKSPKNKVSGKKLFQMN